MFLRYILYLGTNVAVMMQLLNLFPRTERGAGTKVFPNWREVVLGERSGSADIS